MPPHTWGRQHITTGFLNPRPRLQAFFLSAPTSELRYSRKSLSLGPVCCLIASAMPTPLRQAHVRWGCCWEEDKSDVLCLSCCLIACVVPMPLEQAGHGCLGPWRAEGGGGEAAYTRLHKAPSYRTHTAGH